jgi:hypothetical protein
MTEALDDFAPERTLEVIDRPHSSWYTHELRTLKRSVRKAEEKIQEVG